MRREEKDQIIEDLANKLSVTPLVVCADYRGLTVSQINQLRAELTGVGATANVVKNTLVKRSIDKGLESADKAERTKYSDLFAGPSFVIFADENDPVGPAKIASKFEKEFEPFEIKGGWFDGGFLDTAGITELAKLPSKEELLSKLRYLLEYPATQLVRTINAPAQQIVQVVNAYKDTLSA